MPGANFAFYFCGLVRFLFIDALLEEPEPLIKSDFLKVIHQFTRDTCSVQPVPGQSHILSSAAPLNCLKCGKSAFFSS